MPDHTGTVLVIGATGQQGGATARSLLERGWETKAFVRDPESAGAVALREAGATLAVGNLDDPASLAAAMEGAHGVFVALTMMVGPRISARGAADEERRGKLGADLRGEGGLQPLGYRPTNR